MITFQISNIVTEGNQIRVFYRFSSGEESSQLFDPGATAMVLIDWGVKRSNFLEQRAIDIANNIQELREELTQG